MPHQEYSRLEAVYQFLQIQLNKKEEFKEITQLAADICGVPRALITLIGNDTEYVLSDDVFVPNSGRDESFCHYVLQSDEVMIVSDAQLDPRLKDYPAVTREAGIRFYAGAPLTTHDGLRLGSLCVIDHEPGELSAMQEEMLQNLARQVIQLLEFESNLHTLKAQYIEAKRTELKMKSFFDSTATSHLLMDREYKVVTCNKAVSEFIRNTYNSDMLPGMDITQFVNEIYMADFFNSCRRALAGESIKKERLLTFNGRSLWCLISYDPARNNDGEIVGISYNLSDITHRIAQQQKANEHRAKLKQIAFMQSHEIRRPVATIKGLLNLLELDNYHLEYPLLQDVRKDIEEVDLKITKIVNYTVAAEPV